jgi:hypothetical protein
VYKKQRILRMALCRRGFYRNISDVGEESISLASKSSVA